MKQRLALPQTQQPQTQPQAQPETQSASNMLDRLTKVTQSRKITAYSCSYQFTPNMGCYCHLHAEGKIYRVKNPVAPAAPELGTGWYSLKPGGWVHQIEIDADQIGHVEGVDE